MRLCILGSINHHLGMRIHYLAVSAAKSQWARERMRRAGKTPRGHWLWTLAEDAKFRKLYPDYKALMKALRRRTYHSLRNRAQVLGIARKRHVWTGIEVSKLRKLYPASTREVLLAAFPGLRWGQITGKAGQIGVSRRRKKLKDTGFPLIDLIRARAYELNLSMVDVDHLARTKRYFQKAPWCNGQLNRKALLRAVEALGGEVVVRWD